MAKVNMNVNTEDNTLSVSINGQVIPNVTDVSSYRDVNSEGKVIGFYVRISTREELDDDMVKSITYYSYGSSQAEAALRDGVGITNDLLPGFVGIEQPSQVHSDIASFFKGKRRNS
jgi:hypothetical protein